jgi:hypothetical protein
MDIKNLPKWKRKCQECGYVQITRSPATYKDDSWRDVKCKRCKSIALDYGQEVINEIECKTDSE